MSWLDAFLTSYDTIESNGVALPQQTTLDFAAGFTVANDSVLGRTIVSIGVLPSPTLVTPITQGLVEYDELGSPASPNVKVFTATWSTQTIGASPTVIVNPDPNHSAIFDANGVILDDATVTEFEAEFTGTDVTGGSGAIGVVGTWKMSMGWERHAGGAPNPLRSATLLTDSSGTTGPGEPPAAWGVPTLTAALHSGKYYGVPTVTGGSGADAVDWAVMLQWKKTT